MNDKEIIRSLGQEVGYWEAAALRKRRVWSMGRTWTGRLGMGSDEYERRTVYVGRFVVALWNMRPEWRDAVDDAELRSSGVAVSGAKRHDR